MLLQALKQDFSICKIPEITEGLFKQELIFTAKTDQELSLICETKRVPENALIIENGWKCFRIAEDAAFEKYGMIAFLTKIIAEEKTGVLVVASYDTDYLFIKAEKFADVKLALTKNGCIITEA